MENPSANSVPGNLLRTACFNWHAARGGRIVDFAGWEMPVQYSTIVEEHNAVRNAAGLFDIGHMGRLKFTGPDACRFLDSIVTNDLTQLNNGQIRYALVTNDRGHILDDVLVYSFENFYLLVVNASNRLKILDWIEEQRPGFDVQVADSTLDSFMLAIQGPRAIGILNPLVDADIAAMKYYTGDSAKVENVEALISRTGYTGEDGFEVVVPNQAAVALWETLIDAGRQQGLLPAGLGCRDTLRLEAAMPLYGHELDETIDPFTAGLSFAVKLEAAEFHGREALETAKRNTGRLRRVGLELAGRRIAREGAVVISGDADIGKVTSGTFSPTLEKSIAMAYVQPSFVERGTEVEVDIRGKRAKAAVVGLPFYKRDRNA